MQISRPAIKKNSKLVIANTKPSPILIGLVYILILLVLRFLSFAVSGGLQAYLDAMKQLVAVNYDYEAAQRILTSLYSTGAADSNIGIWGNVLIMAMDIMELMLGAGFIVYCLNICQFRKAGVGNLFDGFEMFLRVIALYLLEGIFIFLWSLLLIIPGIVAVYKYRMAIYIMLENPHMGVFECIQESKRMTNGHKGGLFVLDLSFLGWLLLFVVFPPVFVWIAPYYSITVTNYYLALRNMPAQGFDAQ